MAHSLLGRAAKVAPALRDGGRSYGSGWHQTRESFRALAPRHDAFGKAGRGWGNTILNSAPFLRIDQIWLSPELRAVDVYSQKTEHSDHRMVVCDVTFDP
jgi:hypothetical protein